jgi:hypothetical protein
MRHTIRRSRIFRRHTFGVWLVAILIATLVSPVGFRASAQDTPTPSDLSVTTRVYFLHAAPDLGKVEIRLNGDKKIDNLEYGKTSDWVDLDPGTVQISINADRRGVNYLVFNAVYPVPAGNDYYVVITDDLVMGGAFDISPVPDGAARVRVVQASVNLPAVNVVAKGQNVDFAAQLAYPRSSDYITVPAGTFDIDINVAGSGETAASVTGINLEGNNVYDLVIMGDPNDQDHPLTITPLQDTTSASRSAAAEPTGTPAP